MLPIIPAVHPSASRGVCLREATPGEHSSHCFGRPGISLTSTFPSVEVLRKARRTAGSLLDGDAALLGSSRRAGGAGRRHRNSLNRLAYGYT